MEDEIERLQLIFEEGIALASRDQLLQLAKDLVGQGIKEEMRKTQIMSALRKQVEKTMEGEDDMERQLDYMKQILQATDRMLTPWREKTQPDEDQRQQHLPANAKRRT